VTTLLDANVLIALVVADHVHHAAAEEWFAGTADRFATCPVTEGALVRLLVREGQSAATAVAVLEGLAGSPRHEFWPDDVAYHRVAMHGVVGHRQVTDAYLVQLARAHQGRLATLDQGLATLHEDVADLVPSG
jgi:toxin-antitoxin system PIN domain toxin